LPSSNNEAEIPISKTPVPWKCKFHILTKPKEEFHCEALTDDEVTVVHAGFFFWEGKI